MNTSTSVHADFPGGNIIVESLERDTVRLRQDLRDTKGHWFFWHFQADGFEGRDILFEFTDGDVIGALVPAVSLDAGASWQWLGAERVEGASFSYRFPKDAASVRFCMCMPYFQSDFERFLKKLDSSKLRLETIAESRKGRPIEGLTLPTDAKEPELKLLFTCRHHACEAAASYALEGILKEALSDSKTGRWRRENAEILAIPFVDKDGVEDGDQGKNRRPYDHVQGYIPNTVYPEIKAIMEHIVSWAGDKARVALDLHCPYIKSKLNERIFFSGASDPGIWENIQSLSAVIQTECVRSLPFDPHFNYAWGQGWNTSETTFKVWVQSLPGLLVASTLEVPYSNVSGAVATPESLRRFGCDLMRSIHKYLTASDD